MKSIFHKVSMIDKLSAFKVSMINKLSAFKVQPVIAKVVSYSPTYSMHETSILLLVVGFIVVQNFLMVLKYLKCDCSSFALS